MAALNGRPRIDAEAVKAAVAGRGGLTRLAEDLGLEVKGRTLRCPNAEAHAHGDRRASASIGADSWRCHACGAGGDALALLRVARGLTFPEALSALADLVGVQPEEPAQNGRRPWRPSIVKAPARPVEPPKAPSLPESAADLHRAVWRLVEPLPLTAEAEGYLRGRAIEPWAVHEAGARDWWPVRHELRDLLRGASAEAKRAAGFYGEGEEDGKPKPWWPVAALVTGEPRGRGLFVPVFLPGDGETPAGWRWRTIDRGARIKALSMPGAAPLPYGLGLPHGGRLGWLRPAAGHELVVVVEGEPDWWTLAAALGPHAGLVTLTAKTSGWPAWATPHLHRAEIVVVLTHEPRQKAEGGPKPVDPVVDSLFLALSAQRGAEAARRALRVLRQDETADWNDLAQSGRLAERLELLRPVLDATMAGVLRRIDERERAA